MVTASRIYRSEQGETTQANAIFKKTQTPVGWDQQTFQLWKKDYKEKQAADLY
jgi:hypothetical protein